MSISAKAFIIFSQIAAVPVVNICRGAKVQLMGRNFEPDWGLYNGSIGTVKEIVFERDENPLDGTLKRLGCIKFP